MNWARNVTIAGFLAVAMGLLAFPTASQAPFHKVANFLRVAMSD
jgi:hypothetical protein